MKEKASYYYETQTEYNESCGLNYVSYGIFTGEREEKTVLFRDISVDGKEASEICRLLNSSDLEAEQAKYVIEDFIMEKYLVNP